MAAPAALRPPDTVLYRSDEARTLAGCTYRMLDYWVRIGGVVAHVPARGSGSQRQFTEHEVAIARVFHILQQAGIGITSRKMVADAVRSHPQMWDYPVRVFFDGRIAREGSGHDLWEDCEAALVVNLPAALSHVQDGVRPATGPRA